MLYHVGASLGPIAKPARLLAVPELPKTRSGKIMRRLLRDIAENRDIGDTSTLTDASIMDVIAKQLPKYHARPVPLSRPGTSSRPPPKGRGDVPAHRCDETGALGFACREGHWWAGMCEDAEDHPRVRTREGNPHDGGQAGCRRTWRLQ